MSWLAGKLTASDSTQTTILCPNYTAMTVYKHNTQVQKTKQNKFNSFENKQLQDCQMQFAKFDKKKFLIGIANFNR